MKKVKKWIPDTVIARKLHSVLESKDGKILIEVEVRDSFMEAIAELNKKMVESYMKNVEQTLFMSPKQYQQLVDQLEDGEFRGVKTQVSRYLPEDKMYIITDPEEDNGNK